MACGTYEARRDVHRALIRKPEERGHLEDPVINGRISKCSLSKSF